MQSERFRAHCRSWFCASSLCDCRAFVRSQHALDQGRGAAHAWRAVDRRSLAALRVDPRWLAFLIPDLRHPVIGSAFKAGMLALDEYHA